MHQWSSKSIGRLAAALAKAQAELKNPEKTLTATIFTERRSAEEAFGKNPSGDKGGLTFNYASLASGLEIVRKTLSKHGIAAVQTTAIDDSTQRVKLTSVLAHSSGEWIASDWPVCAVKDTETPHRMGAALTYARRYALFTLVGIAGEDDVDAPDLVTPRARDSGSLAARTFGNGHIKRNGSASGRSNTAGQTKANDSPALAAGASSELRDRLISQIAEIGSPEDAALWAYCNVRAKNGLSTADALRVEETFQARLACFPDLQESSPTDGASGGRRLIPEPPEHAGNATASADCFAAAATEPTGAKPASAPVRRRPLRTRRTKAVAGIDKAVLAFPEPRRLRDREHVRFVAKQPCLVCGRRPSDPHHLRFAQCRALGRKASDEFTVPLCRGHHREIHRAGDEAAWWLKAGIEPLIAARTLWLQSHPLAGDGTADRPKRHETKPTTPDPTH
jgi:hypothetical protein